MHNRWRIFKGLLLALTLLAAVAGWLPTAEAALISTKDEIDIGRRYGYQLEKQYGLVNDPALQERVARIGARLAAGSDRKDIDYTFKVLNVKEINALALPGGFVYLFKGLVDYMPTDEELAGIIGHEIGHINKRHTVRQMEKSLGVSILFGVLFGDRGVFLQNLAANAIMAGYSRSDEREADQQGYYLTVKAGYNPYSMLMGLQKLNELPDKGNYGLFSSHPEPEARVSLVQGYLSAAKVHPGVAAKSGTAQITDSGLSLPPLTATYRGIKPQYRAWLAAGALYLASRTADFSGDRFILDSDGTYITIYYDDRSIITLTPQDAAAGVSLDELARQYVDAFKAWANNGRG
jgi:Zn-dependent protease with chaperone function